MGKMVNYLYRRMNRELRKIKYRAIGSAVLIMISVAIYVGFSAMIPIATTALEDKVEDLQLSDYMVHVNEANESEVETIIGIDGVKEVEPRLQVASRLTYQKDGDEKGVASFLYGVDPGQRPRINGIDIYGDGGQYFSGNGSGQILLERNFASTAKVDVGDTVRLNTGIGPVELTVIGLVMTPEYLFLPINPQSLMPYPGNLAVAYVPIDWLQEVFGFPDDFVNEFSIMFDGGQEKEIVEGSINANLSHNIVLFTIPKEEVYGYSLIQQDLSQGEEFNGLFVFLLLAIAFFIVYTSFARIVEEQKREIGVLRALGYSRGKVLGSYIYMAVLIGTIASLIGVLFGIPFGQYLGTFYVEMMLGTPLTGFTLTLDAYIIGMLFGPITAALASIIAVWSTVTMEPQDAIRGVPHTFLKRFKRKAKARKSVGRTSSGSYISRYTLKNMGRHKTRTMITTLAIAGGIMLGAMSLLMMESFENAIEKSIEDYEKWDVLAEFSFPLNESVTANITSPDIVETAYISKTGGQWRFGQESGLAVIVGIDKDQELHVFNVQKGRKVAGDDEVMLNKRFADENGISKGDTIQILTMTGAWQFEVSGLVMDYIGTVYVDMDVAEQLAGGKVYNGMYIKTTAGRSKDVKESLLLSPFVSDAQTRSGAKGGLFEYMDSYNSLLYIMTLLGVAIAAPTLANIVFVGVLERYPEYGQLRAIGYSRGAVAKSIMLELMIIVTIGSIIGAPLTYGALIGYETSFQEFFPAYTTILEPADWIGYLVTVIIIYVIALLAAAPSIRKVNRMDIAKVVSGGRFG